MSQEDERRRIAEHVGWMDKLKVSLTPGDVSEKRKRLSDMADANERAELEAIRQKRMNAGR